MQLLRKQGGIIGRMNLMDFFVSLSLSLELIFHLDGLTSPNEVWIKLEFLFRNKYELRGHQLENELISLKPSELKNIEEFITKFKSLVFFYQVVWD